MVISCSNFNNNRSAFIKILKTFTAVCFVANLGALDVALEMAKQLDRVRMECSACLTFERLARVADEAANIVLQNNADLIKQLKQDE